MADTPPPRLHGSSLIVRLLLGVARWLIPKHEKDWLEDMLFELPFVPPDERFKWARGALALALGLRFSAAERSTAVVTFGTFAITAVVAALVILPARNLPQRGHSAASDATVLTDTGSPEANGVASAEELNSEVSRVDAIESAPGAAQVERTETESLSVELSEPQAVAQPTAAAPLSVEPTEAGLDSATADDSARRSETSSVETASADMDSESPLTDAAANESVLSDSLSSEPSSAETDAAGTSESTVGSIAADIPTDPANIEPGTADTTVTTPLITATAPTYVEVYRGSARNEDALVLKRTLAAGDRLELSPPTLLYTTNAGGLTLNDEALGETGERLARFFP